MSKVQSHHSSLSVKCGKGLFDSKYKTKNSSSAELLKASLIDFYNCPVNIERILPIINRTSPVSLRLLDHFVVNYSATHAVSYPLKDQIFEVHKSYSAQLGKYHKTLFDPFRRGEKITLQYNGKNCLETTLAQLCFFRWCIQNKVLDYVEKHSHAINENMKIHLSRNGVSDGSSTSTTESSVDSLGRRTSRRRSPGTGSVTAVRTALNGNVKYTVRFN